MAAPGGTLTVAAGQHVSERGSTWWDAYYALVLAATLLLVAVSGIALPQRVIAGLALAAAAAGYAAFSRWPAGSRGLTGNHRRGVETGLLTWLMACFAVAVSQDQAASWALWAVVPACFMTARTRPAIITAVVLNLTPAVFLLEPARRAGAGWAVVLAVALTGTVFSVAFGTWVSRIIAQSRERADLIGRLEAAQSELAQISRQAGILAERQRLAGEIHDTLAQGLTSIIMLLQAAAGQLAADPGEARRHIALATRAARENLAEARAMVAALTPVDLAGSNLPDALCRLTGRIGSELGIRASFQARGTPRPLPAATEVVLLRAGQEALSNVRKHADARTVSVVLSYDVAAVRLEVTDDGAGFDPDGATEGYGLPGMRARIAAAEGSLLIRSRPGAGTRLRVEMPS